MQEKVSPKRPFPDSIDWKIVEFLMKDSRKNRQEIADELNISRQTVQKRIALLEEKNIIKFTCHIDEKYLGKELTAIILIGLNRTRRLWSITTKDLWEQRHELGIVEMHHVTGNFDVVLKLKTESMKRLEENLARIASIEGVQTTQTMMSMSSYDSAETNKDFIMAMIRRK